MTGWIIVLVILLLLVLLTLIRVGAEVTYGAEGIGVRLRLGKIWITLLPKKKKSEKKPKGEKKPKKKQKTQSEQKEKKEKEKKSEGGLPIPLMDLISLAVDAVGRLLSRLQIDVLHIEYTIPGKADPAGAAIQYGMLCAGGGAIVPLLENTFYRVKKREIQANVNFEGEEPLVYLNLSLSIRIGQVLAIAGHLLWAFYKSYRKKETAKKETKQEGNHNGTESSDQ